MHMCKYVQVSHRYLCVGQHQESRYVPHPLISLYLLKTGSYFFWSLISPPDWLASVP